MKGTLIAIFSCICYSAASDLRNRFPISQTKTNWDELTASHQAFIEASKTKKDKFSCVLNLLKNALAEELQNNELLVGEKDRNNTCDTNLINIIEENQPILQEPEGQIERPSIIDVNKTENFLYEASVEIVSGQNDSQNFTSIEIPSMIPIFKPRVQTTLKKELNQNLGDINSNQVISMISPSSKRVTKLEVVAFTPESLVQKNLNPIPVTPMFNIPCQRAADVLDMNIAVPKEITNMIINANSDMKQNPSNLKAKIPHTSILNQIPAPPTAKCGNEDDTIAMLFKPKNISLKQVYGNLLKEITLTVLVPYHMTKLGRK